jgi:sialate O-acetylesterase
MALGIALLGSINTSATVYYWDNDNGDNNFLTAANWDAPPVAGNNYWNIDLTGGDKAVLSSGSSPNLAGLHIGYEGTDGEFEQTGGTLTATYNASAASRLGRNGETGTWTMNGGTASINAIQLGLANGVGNLVINNGAMTIARGVNNYSLQVGTGGIGNFEIYDGSLITRTGVFLGDGCTFAVYGSAAGSIGIGSSGSVDGRWVQEAGTLKIRIDSGGVTPIFIDYKGSGDWFGNVTFKEGALLDVGFLSAPLEGEWDVMKWEGTLTDYGLSLAPGVDPAVWGFEFVDTDSSGTPDTLRVRTGAITVDAENSTDANAYGSVVSTSDYINDGQKTFAGESQSPVPSTGDGGFNDGTISGAYYTAAQLPATNTFTLDTALNPGGYAITGITTLAGATSGGANLANQKYEVWVSIVGSSSFSPLESVDYTPFTNGTSGATKVSLGNSTGVLAGGVDQVRFVFLDDGHSFGTADGTVYQEIDIFSSTITPPRLVVSPMFYNKMVLQRDQDVPLWGQAPTGAVVTVKLDGVTVATPTADASGNWTAWIGSHPGDGGVSHTLTISTPDELDIVLADVVFGDVYICSGQSNMARTLEGIGATTEIAAANHPLIRQITIDFVTSSTEFDNPEVLYRWIDCAPAVAGQFCAVGYYFAKQVQATTGEPVGLLFSSWGGRQIQRFVNPEGMAAVPALSGLLQNIENGGVSSYYDIYNAMIAPMAPYGVRGALWYQGEQDASGGDGDIYQLKMRALIRGWREKWAQDAFSFYFVQLCNFITTADWPILREAQLRTLSEPDTGMAVIIDVGNDTNIHPTNKQDPGYRLASWALAKELGYEIPYSSPLYYSSVVEGSQIRVLFDHADGGLMVATKSGLNPPVETAGALENFEIAGSNKVFFSATAIIDADTVLVSSPSVTEPVYVRYCYANAPSGGNKLYNRAGFPASPFRTDSGYEVEVSGGSGAASGLIAGTSLSITANVPASGFVFDRWIGAASAIANPNAATTTVTMPDHDLYLLASYRPSAAATYSITVNNGFGGGTSQAGSIVNIEAQASPTNQVFDFWSGDTQTVVNVKAASTTLRMPAGNISLTAVYTAETPIEFSKVEVDTFQVSSTNVALGFSTITDLQYTVESSTNLNTGAWEPVLYNVTGDGQRKEFTQGTGTSPNQFFRLCGAVNATQPPEGLQ